MTLVDISTKVYTISTDH